MTEARTFALFIAGRPRTKGHMSVVNKGSGAVRDSAEAREWTAICARALGDHARAIGWEKLTGACRVSFTFYGPHDPTDPRYGDWDTLSRAVGDALTRAKVYADDRQATGATVELEQHETLLGVLVMVVAR